MACVDLRVMRVGAAGCDSGSATAALASALRQIEGAVRSDDRICPVGTSRLAVEFGAAASGVLPQVLGDRLARAVRQNLPVDATATGLAISVGMAASEAHLSREELVRHALAAAQAGSAHLDRAGSNGGGHDLVVTVDRLVARSPSGRTTQSLRRRNVYRTETGHVVSARTSHPGPSGNGHDPRIDGMAGDLTVLVVDPLASKAGQPGFAAITAASVVDRLGCRNAILAVSPDDQLTMAVDGVPVDVVVLVLDGGWVAHAPTWASGSWGIPARLAGSYQASEVPVLAVSAGAGAGALAACVAQGALALFSLDGLPDALRSLQKLDPDEVRQVADLGFPHRFRALLGLTASERRVLYYLTEGWAAQDIAAELVVSLTTVRSHIRSVLRKLGVRSQLAAVAIANSRDLESSETTEAS